MNHPLNQIPERLSYSQMAQSKSKPKPKTQTQTQPQASKPGTVSHSNSTQLVAAHRDHHATHPVAASRPIMLITDRPVLAVLDREQEIQLAAYIQSGNLEAIRQSVQKDPNLIHRPNKEGVRLLQTAVFYEQVPIVKFLLSQSADINALDSENNTALTVAIGQTNLLLVHILLESGATWYSHVKAHDQLVISLKKRCSAFFNDFKTLFNLHLKKNELSKKNPKDPLHLQAVLQSITQESFNTPSLSLAITLACKNNKIEWLLFLLNQSVSLQQQDQNQKTALDYLLENKNTIGFEILMHSPCWASLLPGFKMTALQILCANNDIRLLQLFVNNKGVSVDENAMIAILTAYGINASNLNKLVKSSTSNAQPCRDIEEESPLSPETNPVQQPISRPSTAEFALHTACRTNLQPMILHILKKNPNAIHQVDSNGDLPIHIAVKHNRFDIMELFLNHNSCIETPDDNGYPLLHLIISQEKTDSKLKLQAAKRLMPLLHEHTNLKTNQGDTVLHLAVKKWETEVVNYLVSNYPSLINEQNDEKKTALRLTIVSKPSHANHEMFKILLSHKADVNLQDNQGFTCLHQACLHHNSNVIYSLIDRTNLTLTSYGSQRTALFSATKFKHIQCFDLLLSHYKKANLLHSIDRDKNNLLHMICFDGSYKILESFMTHVGPYAILDFDQPNKFLQTPLHIACKTSSVPIQIVTALIDAQFNLKLKNNHGYTPVQTACFYGSLAVIQELLRYRKNRDILAKAIRNDFLGQVKTFSRPDLDKVVDLLETTFHVK